MVFQRDAFLIVEIPVNSATPKLKLGVPSSHGNYRRAHGAERLHEPVAAELRGKTDDLSRVGGVDDRSGHLRRRPAWMGLYRQGGAAGDVRVAIEVPDSYNPWLPVPLAVEKMLTPGAAILGFRCPSPERGPAELKEANCR